MTTLTSGLSFLSCASASMPLRCGMDMSATMASGCSFLAAVTSARPSSTTSTSSKSSARRRFNPSPRTRWSSASRTRGRLTTLLLQWDPGANQRAAAGTALDVDLAAEEENPLPHADMAEARSVAMAGRVEPNSIIAHGQLQPAIDALQADLGLAGAGVARDIAQAFLRDTKQAERHILRQPLGDVAGIRLHAYWRRARDALALRLQCFDEAQVFEQRRVQAIGQGMHVLAQSHQPLAHRLHCASAAIHRMTLRATGVHGQQCQALGHIVVQLTRQARALLLLRIDEPAAQLVGGGFRTPTPVALVQQPGDHDCLHQNHRKGCRDQCTISLPCGRIAKADLASRRQACFADSPPLQLPPVKHRSDDIRLRYGNVRGGLAVQDAQRQPSRLSAKG